MKLRRICRWTSGKLMSESVGRTAAILRLPGPEERRHAALAKACAAAGLSYDDMRAWTEADLKPRVARIQAKASDPRSAIEAELMSLEFQLYCARNGVIVPPFAPAS